MKYFFLLVISFFSLNSIAQTDNENLNTQLNAMTESFLNKDFSIIANYTYPKIVEMMGGKEKMIEVTSATIAKMESQDYKFKSITFKDPSEFMELNGETQCTITQVLVMDTPNGTMQSETTLVAISEDKGQNWTFLDSSSMSRTSLETIYENLHPELEIKAPKRTNIN